MLLAQAGATGALLSSCSSPQDVKDMTIVDILCGDTCLYVEGKCKFGGRYPPGRVGKPLWEALTPADQDPTHRYGEPRPPCQ